MQSLIHEIRELDAEVLGVSVDSPEESQNLAKRADLDFPLLSDPEGTVIDLYGLRHTGGGISEDIARPATFVLDREGRIIWRQLTDNWRIRVRPEPVVEQLRQIR